MLIVFLLVLSAVKADVALDQDGFRKPRQLDLGLQDIRSGDEDSLTTTRLPLGLKDGPLNGYLPPVSSSSSEVVSAQSQQTFDFKSVNSVEKENVLCKFPFDNEACNFKDTSDSKIPKPSRDLVPPFRDVEQDLTFKPATLLEQANKRTTAKAQSTFISTTEKPATKFFKHEPNRKFTKIKATTLRSRVAGGKPEATNELRSFQPPQSDFSAAAQTNVAVIQPANRNNDHDSDHHHGHHHGDNFNICDDAFHSFLCAPLKARKRITGALPVRLLGESSFINYQKTLANFDRETASSNGFRNEYLPPNPFPSNFIQSTYLPPFSTSKPSFSSFSSSTLPPYSPPKFIPESSNFNNNAYLPPAVDKSFSTVNFASSSAEYSTMKYTVPSTQPPSPTIPSTVASTAASTIVQTTASTSAPVTTPASSPTTIPVTTPVTTTTTTPAEISTVVTTTTTTPAPTTIPVTTSASTLAPSTLSKATSGIVTDLFEQNITTAQSTFNAVFPTIPVFNTVPSKANSYLPPSLSPQPSASFISNSKTPSPVTSTSLPASSSFGSFPSSAFGSLPSNSIVSSQKPKVLPTLPSFTSTSSFITTTKQQAPISSFGFQPFNLKNSYLPPPQFQPSFRPPSTTLRPYENTFRPSSSTLRPYENTFRPPSTTLRPYENTFRPSSTTLRPYESTFRPAVQPSNPDLKYLPPDNKEPAAAQISSSAVLAPQNNNPFHHGRDLCTDPFHSFLCASAKPRKKITGELPLGFKPESSNTDELRVKPEPSGQSENKIRPEQSLVNAPTQNNGYKYTKPVTSLPSSVVPPSVPSLTDYSYSKPDKTLPSSSQQDFRLSPTTSTTKPEPVYRPSEARTVSGYQYPKPDKIFPSPGEQENANVFTTSSPPTTGYSYPKPQKSFPLPTETKEIRQRPKQSSSALPPTSVPLPTNQARTYQYPKPDQSFNLPDKKGYSYPKPEKKLELPGETKSKSLLPQSSSSLNGLGNLGSADFIPVNKVEFKRAESSKLLAGLKRFGERMKKRERQAQLLKRQSH